MFDIPSSEVHEKIRLLISKLTNIVDKSGEFVFTLPSDGVTQIDTKTWCPPDGGWDWTMSNARDEHAMRVDYCTSTSRLRSRMNFPSLYFWSSSYAYSCQRTLDHDVRK